MQEKASILACYKTLGFLVCVLILLQCSIKISQALIKQEQNELPVPGYLQSWNLFEYCKNWNNENKDFTKKAKIYLISTRA